MQIELLDTFLDLVESRSFHRTADRLSITQSTVSARVQSLEAAVGARLFSRSRAGTDLTTEGLRFLAHARLLRQEWNEARRVVASSGEAAMTLRLGIQQDIAAVYLGDLVAELRKVFPQTAFYIEPDYSAQMCADLSSGAQDFAVLFTPKMHPDLYFASAGEIPYRLVSSDCAKRADIKVDGYISGHFSPAFDQAHAQLLPELVAAPLSVGQSSAIFNLLQSLGGTGFVMEQQAKDMVASGRFSFVEDVQTIHQPIYAAMHLRHRISKAHRRMTSLVQRKLGGKTA